MQKIVRLINTRSLLFIKCIKDERDTKLEIMYAWSFRSGRVSLGDLKLATS